MKLTIRLLLPLLPVALLATGCTSRLIFATHSSIGLDVSGTAELPNKISFSFSRYEAAIVPRKTNGEAHSVYGGMDADVTWFHGHAIKQTFATGEAAKLATANPAASGVKDPPVGTKKQDKDALVFFTATTYGLKLAIGEDATPPNLLLGYRRSEAAVIPIPDLGQEVRSVYADIQINTRHDEALNQITTNFSAIKGTRIKQSFATGRAAENLAGNPVVRAKLDEAAGLENTSANLRGFKKRAEGIAVEIEEQLDRIDNDKLDMAVDAFQAAGFISDDEVSKWKKLDARNKHRTLKAALAVQLEDEFQTREQVDNLLSYLNGLRKIP